MAARALAIGAIVVGLFFEASATDAAPAFADEFSSATLGPAWRARQGIWRVADGHVAGRKDPMSKHPAKLDLLLPQGDGILEFSFKTDRPGGVDVFFNRGDLRIAVVQLRADGMAFATYPKTKDVPSEPTYLARSERKLDTNHWHHVRIERRDGCVWIRRGTIEVLEVCLLYTSPSPRD